MVHRGSPKGAKEGEVTSSEVGFPVTSLYIVGLSVCFFGDAPTYGSSIRAYYMARIASTGFD